MPDHRLLAIQLLEPQEDDSLTEAMLNLIEPYRCRVTMSCDCRLG
jgi:hypothetical protein